MWSKHKRICFTTHEKEFDKWMTLLEMQGTQIRTNKCHVKITKELINEVNNAKPFLN